MYKYIRQCNEKSVLNSSMQQYHPFPLPPNADTPPCYKLLSFLNFSISTSALNLVNYLFYKQWMHFEMSIRTVYCNSLAQWLTHPLTLPSKLSEKSYIKGNLFKSNIDR